MVHEDHLGYSHVWYSDFGAGMVCAEAGLGRVGGGKKLNAGGNERGMWWLKFVQKNIR